MNRRKLEMQNYNYEDVIKCDNFTYSIIPKNSQFKGNMNELAHNKNEDGEVIVLCNSYYTGFSRQEYSIDNGITTHDLYNSKMSPKYLRNLYDECIKMFMTYTRQPGIINNIEVKIDDTITFVWTGFAVNLTQKIVEPGFKFRNNLHNIKRLKELNELYKSIRNILKNCSAKDIFEMYQNTVYDLEHDYPTIRLSANKLFDHVLKVELKNNI